MASLRTLAGQLTAEITLLEAAIADLLAHHDGYHAIQALPGIGPVLATGDRGRDRRHHPVRSRRGCAAGPG
jgi:hypothetical protein